MQALSCHCRARVATPSIAPPFWPATDAIVKASARSSARTCTPAALAGGRWITGAMHVLIAAARATQLVNHAERLVDVAPCRNPHLLAKGVTDRRLRLLPVQGRTHERSLR